MAEAPLSPEAGDLHAIFIGSANDSSTNPLAEIDSPDVVGVRGVVVNLQCPVTPQLRLKSPDISNSSDTDGEEQRSNSAAIGAGESAARTASPPPNCAICLGRCKNKCFTDTCVHQFCFKCLCEWSKVKPECPLCKQTFKSIIHNVKSIDQFEEYHVQPPTVQIPHRPIEVYGQFLPYIMDNVINGRSDFEIWDSSRSTRVLRAGRSVYNAPSANYVGAASGSGGSSSAQSQFEFLEMYQQENPDAVNNVGTLSQMWRRYVYDRKLYALPVCDPGTGRFRETSARFYRENPAQVHRLMPWINRDIVCLLRDTEHDVTTILGDINECLSVFNVASPTFRRRMQPILGNRTFHFMHELQNFARSPYDMYGYDRAVQYAPQATEAIEFSTSSSSDESVNIVNVADASVMTDAQQRSHHHHQTRADHAPVLNMLSFTISTTSEGGEAPGVTSGTSGRGTQSAAINLTTHNRSSDLIIDLDGGAEGSDGSQNGNADGTRTSNEPSGAISIELTSSSSDECEFVLERKPPHLRTPELVSLNSESDSDVVFVEVSHIGVDDADPIGDAVQSKASKRAQVKRESEQKWEQEQYNVGASTSSGLRSSMGGRRREQQQLIARTERRQQLRRKRRSLRGVADDDSAPATRSRGARNGGRRMRPISSSIQSSTSSSTDTSSEDSCSENESNKGVRKRKKPTTRLTQPSVKRTGRPAKRSRNTTAKVSSSKAMRAKRTHSAESERSSTKRCRVSDADGGSSADDDDSLCLEVLKIRLAALREIHARGNARLSGGEERSQEADHDDDNDNDDDTTATNSESEEPPATASPDQSHHCQGLGDGNSTATKRTAGGDARAKKRRSSQFSIGQAEAVAVASAAVALEEEANESDHTQPALVTTTTGSVSHSSSSCSDTTSSSMSTTSSSSSSLQASPATSDTDSDTDSDLEFNQFRNSGMAEQNANQTFRRKMKGATSQLLAAVESSLAADGCSDSSNNSFDNNNCAAVDSTTTVQSPRGAHLDVMVDENEVAAIMAGLSNTDFTHNFFDSNGSPPSDSDDGGADGNGDADGDGDGDVDGDADGDGEPIGELDDGGGDGVGDGDGDGDGDGEGDDDADVGDNL